MQYNIKLIKYIQKEIKNQIRNEGFFFSIIEKFDMRKKNL